MSLDGNTQGKVIKRVLILTIIAIGVIFIIYGNYSTKYIYGIIFGVSINILSFRLMALTLERAVKMPQHKVMPYVVANYTGRYIIYGVVLTVAAVADYISFFTTILGLIMVKAVILADTIYGIVKKKTNSTTK